MRLEQLTESKEKPNNRLTRDRGPSERVMGHLSRLYCWDEREATVFHLLVSLMKIQIAWHIEGAQYTWTE